MVLHLLEGQVFDPAAISAMTQAYEAACTHLSIDPDDEQPLRDLLARTIIELCKAGELDSKILCAKALLAIRG